jgi:hypothetical protein
VGAWGEGPFENDDAADFVGDLVEAGGDAGAVLDDALRVATEADGEVKGPEAALAVAAACIVAARVDPGVLAAAGPDGEDEELSDWLGTAPFEVTVERVELAREALDHTADGVSVALAPYREILDR